MDESFDGVGAQGCAVAGREQWRIRLGVVGFHPFSQCGDGAGGQWCGSLLSALASAANVWPGCQCEVLTAQAGEFGDAQAGLDREGE